MKDCPGPVVRSRHLVVAASLPQPLVAGPCLQHRGSGGRPLAGSSAPMRPISGLSSCAARSRMHDALAALLVASPGSGPPGSPNLTPRVFGRASASEPACVDVVGGGTQVAVDRVGLRGPAHVADPED